MVDKVAWGQVFPRVLRFSPVSFIPPVLHYLEKWKSWSSFSSSLSQGCTISLLKRFPPRSYRWMLRLWINHSYISFFWDFTQRRRFGTTYRSYLQRSSSPRRRWDDWLSRKVSNTSLRCVTSQKSEDLIYTAAKASNRTVIELLRKITGNSVYKYDFF